jgi:tetratricopeptide (TPR) repeat protein
MAAALLPVPSSLDPNILPPAAPQALLARTSLIDGKYAEACALHEQLVAMTEAEQLHDPKVGDALNDLAHVSLLLGNYPLARSTAERALKINEAALGPDHLDVARSLYQLARVIKRQNELDAAQSLLERALAIQEAALGPNHTNVASTLFELGKVLQMHGKLPSAARRLKRALNISEAAHGSQSRQVAAILQALASVVLDCAAAIRSHLPVERRPDVDLPKVPVVATLTVNETGRTVSHKATGFAGEVDSCIEGLMGSWRFPVPKDKDGEGTEASFSITLQLVPD